MPKNYTLTESQEKRKKIRESFMLQFPNMKDRECDSWYRKFFFRWENENDLKRKPSK